MNGEYGLDSVNLTVRGIDRLGLLDIGEEIGEALAERLHAVEREDHVVGGQRIAALELHVGAQLEGVGLAVGLPAFGEMRHDAGAALASDSTSVS